MSHIWGRCTNGKGELQSHPATGMLCAPDERPITAMCAVHAQEVVVEYKRKLGEKWSYRPRGKEVTS